jgi:hypothetical protein
VPKKLYTNAPKYQYVQFQVCSLYNVHTAVSEVSSCTSCSHLFILSARPHTLGRYHSKEGERGRKEGLLVAERASRSRFMSVCDRFPAARETLAASCSAKCFLQCVSRQLGQPNWPEVIWMKKKPIRFVSV